MFPENEAGRSHQRQFPRYLQGHQPVWLCEIRDVLAKAKGTGRKHECHNDNSKHLLMKVSGLHGAAQCRL